MKPTFIDRFVSALIWLFIVVMVLFWVPAMAIIFAVTVPFDSGRYIVGRWFRWAACLAIFVNPRWRFRTSGVRPTDMRRPYVVVANHESYADIFLLSMLPWEMKWLSKAQIVALPLMGWMMRMAGDIAVQRDSPESRAAALDGVRDRLRKNVSVMIMPEGTRSRTEDMLPFRDGAFRVAVEMGLPVLPVAVAGTRNAMMPGSFIFSHATAEARVLDPIETTGMTMEDVPAFREDVRERIRVVRDQLRKELGHS
jgi:1-acyl-sn-glycerol-3-phosphate acyltransferase